MQIDRAVVEKIVREVVVATLAESPVKHAGRLSKPRKNRSPV